MSGAVFGGQAREMILCVALLAAGASTALWAVIAAHDNRQLWRQQQLQKSVQATLEMEWKRLTLERGAQRGHSRIERIARQRMDMTVPAERDIVIVDLGSGI